MTQGFGSGEVIWFCYTVHFFTFSQTKICWNNQNTLCPKIRIWHLGVLTTQKFINIALVVRKIFKVVKSSPSPRHFTKIKPDVNEVKVKSGCVRLINFCGWSSKIFHASFVGNFFYICLKTCYAIDPFYHGFLKKILINA